MRKIMFIVTIFGVIVSFATVAFAENIIGFQFRVPFQVVGKKDLRDVSGQSTLLTFKLDQDTEVGILNEHVDYRDNKLAASAEYDVTAIRISKGIMNLMYVGLDLGNANFAAANKTMADVFGGVKLLTSKARVSSFLNVEVAYRFMKVTPVANGVNDFSGALITLGAGINF